MQKKSMKYTQMNYSKSKSYKKYVIHRFFFTSLLGCFRIISN